MKINKNETIYWIYYYHINNDKTIIHGLINDTNEHIGYHYQGNQKGFWLVNATY